MPVQPPLNLTDINVGSAPNDNTGDPLRTGGQKVNTNLSLLEAESVYQRGLAGPIGPLSGTISGTVPVYMGTAVGGIQRYTLSGPGTVAFLDGASNLPIRPGDRAVVEVLGDFPLSFPASVVKVVGVYAQGASNLLRFTALATVGTYSVEILSTFAAPKTGLVFRQVMPNYFANDLEARNKNASSVSPATETLFSVLDRLEEYRSANGYFYFRLNWPAISDSWSWRQRSNPLDYYEEVEGYELIGSTGGPTLTGMNGLSRSSWGGALLDARPGVQGSADGSALLNLQGLVGRLLVGDDGVVPDTIPAGVGLTTTTVELFVDGA